MRSLLFLISLHLLLVGSIICEAKNDNLTGKSDCRYVENKVNEETGTLIKKMEWELLLSHVGDQASTQKSNVNDPFAAYGYLANYNNSIMLYVRMEILSTQAKKVYGHIFEGDKLLFKLSNGEIVSLESGKSEIGTVQGNMTSYSIFFPVSEDVVSKLKKEEITKARIHWSKGYMDYKITNSNFFVRQLTCVE